MDELIDYFIVFSRPAKLMRSPGRGITILKFDWETGGFISGNDLSTELFYGPGDSERVTEDEFIQYVEELRGRRIKGEGKVYDLYAAINGIEDTAKEAGRRLTPEERANIAEMRRETYRLFE
ncbi:MAG: hypothetical protein JXB07_14960 [Anaerolineae bacterium]|nr:hypothetical protein [Anaerolineae bacterium]